MKKRSYRAQKVNEVRWEEAAVRVKDKAVVWAVDVATVEQFGVLMDSEREVVVTVKWAHAAEIPALLEWLRGLACGSLTAVMESTGVCPPGSMGTRCVGNCVRRGWRSIR